MRSTVALLLLILALGACSRDQAPSGSTGAGVGGDAMPKVSYAQVLMPDPSSDAGMTIQYTVEPSAAGTNEVVFRWYVDGSPVEGATGDVLEKRYFQKGSSVEAEVIPTDGTNLGTPYRTKAMVVRNAPPVVTAASFQPVPAFAGDTITVAVESSDPDGDAVTYQYKWKVNNADVPGGTAELNTASLKKKEGIMVTVTPFDGEDQGAPFQSTVLFLSNRSPEITSVPPTSVTGGMFVYQVVAKDPDGDPIAFSLENAPAGMTIDSRSGRITWQAPQGQSGRVEMQVRIAADDGDGGVGYQEFTLGTELK